MAKRNPSDPAGAQARQARKPQTIELEATEVTSEPTSAQKFDPSAHPEESTAPPDERQTARGPAGNVGVMIAAGAMGIAGALVVIGALSMLGFIGHSPNALDNRLSGMEAQLSEMAARSTAPRNDSKALESLAARVERIEKAGGAGAPPLNDAALANRLTSAENATKANTDDVGGLNRRVDELGATLRELRTRVDTIAPVEKSEIEAMANRIATLEKAAGTMETEIGKRATVTSDRAVRLALATSALRAAVERGEPFAAELATARPLAADNAFAALEPFAGTGVPSNAALAGELTALVPALRTAANAQPAEGGYFERLKSSFSRLVRIRPVDDTTSDDPAAVIARIEQKAASMDVAGALADLAKLPAPVRAPAQAWIEKAQARIAAVQTSRQLAADAIGALGKVTP